MILFSVTYTVTAPDDLPEAICTTARSHYGFALEKNMRRMAAVTSGLRHVDESLRAAKLDIAMSHCIEYDKGATSRRMEEAKERHAKEHRGRLGDEQ